MHSRVVADVVVTTGDCRYWNRLPASIVSAENIQTFKKLLNQDVLLLRNVWKGLILMVNNNNVHCDVQ